MGNFSKALRALLFGAFLPAIAVAQTTPASFIKGDFNGDGEPDLVFQDSSGGLWVKPMANATPHPSQWLLPGGAPSSDNWRFAGTPDLNNDGRTDTLWRNQTTGRNAVWLLDGQTYLQGLELLSVVDANWEIAATADFNNDSHDDIVWRNRTTGQNAIWYMQGSTYDHGVQILAVEDPNWIIAAAADVTGDGKPDLLWRNIASGANSVWVMNDSTYIEGIQLHSVTDLNWSIGGAADLNDDGTADILWQKWNFPEEMVHVWYLSAGQYLSGAFITDNVRGRLRGPR